MADEPEDEVIVETPVVEGETEIQKVIEPEEGIEALRARLAESDAARATAEANAAEATRRANAAHTSAADAHKEKTESDLALVTNAIESLGQSQGVLKANYAAAAAAGDWDAASEAQLSMATNAAKIQTLETGKTELEEAAKNPPKPEVIPLTDPVEIVAAQLSGPSAAWVRSHPEFARDPNKFNMMVSADGLVRGRGMAPDTPQYFAAVEELLGLKTPVQEESPLSEAAQRSVSPPAAPARRDSPSGNTVRLSAEELDLAESMGLTKEEWAQQKAAIAKEKGMH